MTIADDAFTFVERALEKFKNGSPDAKRLLFMKLGSNRTLIDKKLKVDVEETLVPMKIARDEDERIREHIRTAKKSMNTRALEDFYSESPTMLRAMAEVRTAIRAKRGQSPFAIARDW